MAFAVQEISKRDSLLEKKVLVVVPVDAGCDRMYWSSAFVVAIGAFVALLHDLGASRFFTVTVCCPLFHDHRLIDCDRQWFGFTESL